MNNQSTETERGPLRASKTLQEILANHPAYLKVLRKEARNILEPLFQKDPDP